MCGLVNLTCDWQEGRSVETQFNNSRHLSGSHVTIIKQNLHHVMRYTFQNIKQQQYKDLSIYTVTF